MMTNKWMRKVLEGLLLLIMCAVMGGCGDQADLELKSLEVTEAEEEASPEEPSEEAEAPEAEPAPSLIKVFVCGQVAREGVYELPEGSRVCDAVEAAGGFTAEADETYVNQADFVSDAQKLYIPAKSEVREMEEKAASSQEDPAGGNDGLVNINTADLAALMTLPGIGQTKAQSILDYRQQNGPFEKAEDLMQVSGIGQASFDKLKMYITVK